MKVNLYKRSLLTLILCIFIFFFFTEALIFSETSTVKKSAGVSASDDRMFFHSDSTEREIVNTAFNLGESLHFEIVYGPINAGYATLEVIEITEIDSFPCFRILSKAYSNKFFSTFYKVRDRAESFIDIKGIFSRRFEKHLREGSYKQDRIVTFDYNNGIANSTKKGQTKIPPFTQDILSALYYLRTRELKTGESHYIDSYADGKVYPLQVNVYRKEKVKVKAGEFECFVVEPIMRTEGVFKHEGKLLVWLTADQYKIPVQMKSKVLVGSISAKLKSYNRN